MITSNGYIEKRSSSLHLPWYKAIPDDHYVYIHLPHHMIKSGERKMCEKASLVLQDEGFITGRMTSMGTKEGTQAQCADAELLGNSLQGLDTRKGNKDILHDEFLLIFYATKFFLKRHILALDHSMEVDNATLRSRQNIGESFAVYGIALKQQSLWLEALDVFSEALNIFKGAELEDDNPAVLRTRLHMHSSTLPKIVLVPRNSACCIKLKHATKLLGTLNNDGGKKIKAELESHPGLAIVLMRTGFTGFSGGRVKQLSVGPKESAIHICSNGGLLHESYDGSFITSYRDSQVGDSVFLAPSSYMHQDKFPGQAVDSGGVVVIPDGTITLSKKPDLALGIGPYPVVLVACNSPNRFILKYGKELKNTSHPLQQKGHRLELLSHPGQAITTQLNLPLNFGSLSANLLVLGTDKDAIEVSHDGRVIASSEGAVFNMNAPHNETKADSAIILVQYNNRIMTRWKGGHDFVINEEGSISPSHHQHLVLGCSLHGIANDIISVEEKEFAEKKSQRRLEKAPVMEKIQSMLLALGVLTRFKSSRFRN